MKPLYFYGNLLKRIELTIFILYTSLSYKENTRDILRSHYEK